MSSLKKALIISEEILEDNEAEKSIYINNIVKELLWQWPEGLFWYKVLSVRRSKALAA